MADVEHVIRSARTSRLLAAHVCPERSPLHDVRQHAHGERPVDGTFRKTRIKISDKPVGSFSDGYFLQVSRRDRRWWSQTGSNRRPPACKAGALPTELWPRSAVPQQRREMVGLGRFELPTSRLSSARSNQLSYKPASQVSAISNQDSERTRRVRYLIPEY